MSAASGRDDAGGHAPALVIRDLSKTFPGTRALRSVSLTVRPGGVHALLGGNGSGKSTLVKVLAGVHRGDPGGSLRVGASAVPSDQMTPERARQLGLHFVHQHPSVFPDLSVAENLAIGHGFQTVGPALIRGRTLRRRTQALLDRFEIDARPTQLLRSLRPAARTMVAIARALQDQEDSRRGVLVLDEPTAALPAAEVNRLLEALRRYAEAGQAIVFISHRLDEVGSFADDATVLRDGRVAGSLRKHELHHDRLVELITGRSVIPPQAEATPTRAGDVVLSVRHLCAGPLRNLNFDLHRGEVLGIAGLLGSGRTELLRAVFGAQPVQSGAISLHGVPVRFGSVSAAMRSGVAYVPEDRAAEAAFEDLSVTDNIAAARVRHYFRGMWLGNRAARRDARGCIHRFGIRAESEHQLMSTLSGGNQQKAILARWLERRPDVLLLDEPTQGVDVGARSDLYSLVNEAVGRGCAVMVVTSDFEELSQVAHRVLVLAGGRFVAEVRTPNIDPVRLTQLSFTQEVVAS